MLAVFNIAGLNIQMDINTEIFIDGAIQPFKIEAAKGAFDISYSFIPCEQSPNELLKPEYRIDVSQFAEHYLINGAYYRKSKMGGYDSCLSFDINRFDELKCFVSTPKNGEYAPVLSCLLAFELPLLQFGGFSLHSSLVKYKGRAVLFSAPSGTGKSTQARLWQTHLGAETINGDRALLRKLSRGWQAYGSPWAGTSCIYRQESAEKPIVFIVRQSANNRVTELSKAEAFKLILSEAQVQHWQPQLMAKSCDLIEQFVRETPIYFLECRPDLGAVNAALEIVEG
ncbi:MAG: hypothetical protein LBS74_08935 [Oscillospiraceae bacterium]|jgi:hypothetical protein|nr:hypothetical protein [Oscillospiraceae bacterium]